MIEKDTHDKLILCVLDYFALNEEFQQRPSELKRRKVRKKLQEIKLLCQQRREEIIRQHVDQLKDKRKNNNPKKAREARYPNN